MRGGTEGEWNERRRGRGGEWVGLRGRGVGRAEGEGRGVGRAEGEGRGVGRAEAIILNFYLPRYSIVLQISSYYAVN